MKKIWILAAVLGFTAAGMFNVPAFSAEKTAAELEKEKALANPYPNDFGPDKVDASKYGAEEQQGYKLLLDKCSRCHTPSRPLNSQFLQLKADEQAKAKASNPEIFKDKKVWQVEDAIWQRYVKRMMAKPGCAINEADGKKIFRFLVADSKARKTGANAKSWAGHRGKLLSDFKAKYPARHKELFETP